MPPVPCLHRFFRMFLILAILFTVSCDRDSLSDGPALSGSRPTPGPGGNPDPDPGACPPPPAVNRLRVKVNEVMVENTKTLADENGKFPPWIELHNPTAAEVNLGDVPLSDDLSLPKKWTIPCVPEAVIPPGGFLVIFADGDTAAADDFHANFTLARGPILIALNKGSDIFEFDATDLGADLTVGRSPDGSGDVAELEEPTPAKENSDPAGPTTPPEGKFVRGDADANGRVTITDMTLVSRVTAGAESIPPCADALDSNDDGLIDSADVSYLGNWMSGTGPPPRPPFPAADLDPTTDALVCPEPPAQP